MALADLDDAELARGFERAGEGWPDGEAELYRRFAPRVRLYGRCHLRDDHAADDLVQEVLCTVIAKLRAGEVREPERLASFVLGTSRHAARDMRRTAGRRQDILARFGAGAFSTPAPEPAERLDLERLRRCVEGLPHRERTVVMMTFFAERPSLHIGQELGMAEGNVRVVRHRALGRLRGCMEGAPS